MDHAYYKDRISAFFDGALPPYEQRAVEEHVAQCAECRETLEKLRALSSLTEIKSALGENEYWENQAQDIERKLGIGQTEVTRIRPRSTWQGLTWKLAAAAASIAVVGVIGFYSWESIRERTERPPIQMAPSIQRKDTSAAVPDKSRMQQEAAPNAVERRMKSEQATDRSAESDTENYKIPAGKGKLSEQNKPTSVTPPARQAVPESNLIQPSTVTNEAAVDTAAAQESVPMHPVDELRKTAKMLQAIGESSKVPIRSGRAGEVVYLVDTLKRQSPTAPSAAAPRPAGETLGIEKETLQPVTIGEVQRKGQLLGASAAKPPVDSLQYWRDIRSSLEEVDKLRAPVKPATIPSAKLDSTLGRAPMGFAKTDAGKGVARIPTAKEKDTILNRADSAEMRKLNEAELLRLRACYEIARLSSDTAEVAEVYKILRRVSSDFQLPYHTTAKAYLDSLGRR